jgi:hypothetical protein
MATRPVALSAPRPDECEEPPPSSGGPLVLQFPGRDLLWDGTYRLSMTPLRIFSREDT